MRALFGQRSELSLTVQSDVIMDGKRLSAFYLCPTNLNAFSVTSRETPMSPITASHSGR